MRELNLRELEHVSGGQDDNSDELRQDTVVVVGQRGGSGSGGLWGDTWSDGVSSGMMGDLGITGPLWFGGVHSASDGSLWISEESAEDHEQQLEEQAMAEQQEAACASIDQAELDIAIEQFTGNTYTLDEYSGFIITNEMVRDSVGC